MNLKKRIKKVYSNFLTIIKRPDMSILPGQLAFFFVLSVVPIITLICYGATFLHIPINAINEFISNTFSSKTASLIIPSLGNASFSLKFALLTITCIYIASNGCKSLILTSNAIYGIKNKNRIKIRTKAILMAIIIVSLLLFILVVPLFGSKIMQLISKSSINADLLRNIKILFIILKGPITWFILFVFIKLLYTMAPDKKIPSSYVNLGALFTSLGWTLSTALYSYYITNFAIYDIVYAGLSNIVILMLWIYLLAIIFVFGLALNFKKEKDLSKTGLIKIVK